MTFATVFASAVELLQRAGVPHMITGSLASTFHGEPRATLDIDIVVDPDQDALERLVGALLQAGWYVDPGAAADALRDRSQFNAIGPDATKVDFIVRKERPFSRTEFGRRQRANLLGIDVDIVTAEDLIIAKLEWSAASDSERQLRDVAGMLAIGANALDRDYIAGWAESLGVGALWRQVGGMEPA